MIPLYCWSLFTFEEKHTVFPPSVRTMMRLNICDFLPDYDKHWCCEVCSSSQLKAVYGDRGVDLSMENVTEFALCPKRFV